MKRKLLAEEKPVHVQEKLGAAGPGAMPIMQGLVYQTRLPDSMVRAAESHQRVLSKL